MTDAIRELSAQAPGGAQRPSKNAPDTLGQSALARVQSAASRTGSMAPSGSVRDLTVDIVDSLDGLAAARPDYERLGRAAGNALPFSLHEWHLTWCAHFLNLNPRFKQGMRFHLLRNLAGECIAIFPLILNQRAIGPLTLGWINLIGADASLTEIRAPLVEPGWEAEAVGALRHSLARVRGWDWIHWTAILDPALYDALDAGARLEAHPMAPAPILDLAPTWEEFRAGLKRNIRESLRHCYNSLKREGHEFELLVAQDEDAVRESLERFFALHGMRADLTDTVQHPNRFEGEASRRFLHAVCRALALRGTVRVFQLQVGAQIVAVRIGFVVGDSLYLYYSGFDPQWARYSVMTTTVAEAIKYAIAQGLKTVNLSPGTDHSKTRWGTRPLPLNPAYEWRNRLRSRIARMAYLSVRSGNGPQSRLVRLLQAHRDWS